MRRGPRVKRRVWRLGGGLVVVLREGLRKPYVPMLIIVLVGLKGSYLNSMMDRKAVVVEKQVTSTAKVALKTRSCRLLRLRRFPVPISGFVRLPQNSH